MSVLTRIKETTTKLFNSSFQSILKLAETSTHDSNCAESQATVLSLHVRDLEEAITLVIQINQEQNVSNK